MPKYIGVKGPLDGVVIFPLSRLVGRHGRPGRLRPRAARSARRRASLARESTAAWLRDPPWCPRALRAPRRPRAMREGAGERDGREGGRVAAGRAEPFRAKLVTDSRCVFARGVPPGHQFH